MTTTTTHRSCLVCGAAISYYAEPGETTGIWIDRNGRRQKASMLTDMTGDPDAPEHFHVPA